MINNNGDDDVDNDDDDGGDDNDNVEGDDDDDDSYDNGGDDDDNADADGDYFDDDDDDGDDYKEEVMTVVLMNIKEALNWNTVSQTSPCVSLLPFALVHVGRNCSSGFLKQICVLFLKIKNHLRMI